MNSVEVEEILKEDPLTWERTTSGFMTFLHGVSSLLSEALGAEYYVIVICNAPFERSTRLPRRTTAAESPISKTTKKSRTRPAGQAPFHTPPFGRAGRVLFF